MANTRKYYIKPGETYGQWKVLSQLSREKGRDVFWLCECSCGKVKSVAQGALGRGKSLSCGCRAKGPQPRKIKDISGCKSGKLTALQYVETLVSPSGTRRDMWLCLCECGVKKVFDGWKVRSGRVKSCGCNRFYAQRGERTQESYPEYACWKSMLQRCRDSGLPAYKNYGGRGIKVCEAWVKDFYRFLKDVGERPSPYHSLNRIDNEGDYAPGNVEWATTKEQLRNTRVNLVINFKGREQCLAAWCEELNLNYHTIWRRIKKLGWDPVRAIATPIGARK